MSREQTTELFASRATEGSELDLLVMHEPRQQKVGGRGGLQTHDSDLRIPTPE
jgi:hypothetical protein